MENYYRALNLASTATDEEIKKAILRDRRLWNNRTNAPDLERQQEAQRMVAMLANAEQILLDPARRQQYDVALRNAPGEPSRVNETKVESQQEWIRESRRFLSDGDIASALYAANQATQVDGSNPEAWAVSAQAKFRWGQIQDALYEYRRAIDLRPNEAQYYFDRGNVFESIEDWPNALQNYQWASRIDPMSTMYRASVGEMCFQLDRYEEAISILKQCVTEAPENRTYREYLALAYGTSSYEHWTTIRPGNRAGLPEGQYATTKFQVDEALASVQKAQQLDLQTPEVRDLINSIHANIKSMLARHFHGNWFAAGASILLGLIILFSSSAWGLYYLFGGVFYIVSCFTPQYLVNRKIIEGKDLSNSFISSLLFEGGVGCMGMIVGILLIVVLLPIMATANFLRNWVLAPLPNAAEKQRMARMQMAQPQPMPEIVINQQAR